MPRGLFLLSPHKREQSVMVPGYDIAQMIFGQRLCVLLLVVLKLEFEGKKRISAEEAMTHGYFGNLGKRVMALPDSKTQADLCPRSWTRTETSPSPLLFQQRLSSVCRRFSWKRKRCDRQCPLTRVARLFSFVRLCDHGNR